MKVFSQTSMFGRLLRAADQDAHDFLAGGVAQGVGDAVAAMPALAPSANRSPAWSNCVPQSINSPMRCGASRMTRSTTSASHSAPPASSVSAT